MNTDLLAVDHHNGLPIEEILAKHDITLKQYHDWALSPDALRALTYIKAIERTRAPNPDTLRRIAIQGLANLAASGKTTESVRKACHDLRDAADEYERANPNATTGESVTPLRRRTYTKENLPRFLHAHIEKLNNAELCIQPGKHNIDYWGFDPDDPESIAQMDRDRGYG